MFARCLSALKDERVVASERLTRPHANHDEVIPDKRDFIKHISKVTGESTWPSAFKGDELHVRVLSGTVCVEDCQLRSRLHADGRGQPKVRLEPELWRDCADVERRVHHQVEVGISTQVVPLTTWKLARKGHLCQIPRRHQEGLRQEARLGESPSGRLLLESNGRGTGSTLLLIVLMDLLFPIE